MRRGCTAALVMGTLLAGLAAAPVAQRQPAARKTVLVELFTSQG